MPAVTGCVKSARLILASDTPALASANNGRIDERHPRIQRVLELRRGAAVKFA